jgi:hypothetical protein
VVSIYLTYVVESATTTCLLLIQVIAPPNKLNTYTLVDILRSRSPTQSASVGMFTGRVCLSLIARSEYAAMEKKEQHKLRRISAESHAVRRCAPESVLVIGGNIKVCNNGKIGTK